MNFKEGDIISGGDIFGQVYENELIPEHNIMCPPKSKGTVSNGMNGIESYDISKFLQMLKVTFTSPSHNHQFSFTTFFILFRLFQLL